MTHVEALDAPGHPVEVQRIAERGQRVGAGPSVLLLVAFVVGYSGRTRERLNPE